MRSIHLRALPRMLLICVLLSIGAGALAYAFQMSRVDPHLLHQAQLESTHLRDPSLAEGSRSDRLARSLELLTQGQFRLARVYDAERRLLAQSVSTHADPALATYAPSKPLPFSLDHAAWQRVQINSLSALAVSIPLSRGGQPWGLLEGLYMPDPLGEQHIRDELAKGVLMAVVAVLTSAAVVYPLTVSLYRSLARPSVNAQAGNLEVLEMVGNMIAARDSDSNAHNYRVTLYALALAREARLAPAAVPGLIAGAFLHDIGKIAISDAILRKPGRLSDEELAEMRNHVRRGVDLVKRSRWLVQAREIIEYHHEKFDGSGYPRGAAGENIPLPARIFAIADVFDALTSMRPYKSAAPLEDALLIITRESGRHFDPELVAAFLVVAADSHRQWQCAGEDALRASLEPHLRASCSI